MSIPRLSLLLTAPVAFGGTVAGVLVLYLVQPEIVPRLLGGYDAICGSPDCGLGIGVWLIFGGFVVALASLIAGVAVTIRYRHETSRLAALRRGLFVCLWCLLAYVGESVVLWSVV
jgi:hypothetical protein